MPKTGSPLPAISGDGWNRATTAGADDYRYKMIEKSALRFEEMPKPLAPGMSQEDLRTLMTLYVTNPWVYAAGARVASAIASVRRIFFVDGKRVPQEESRLGRIFLRPNPFPQTIEDLMESVGIDMTVIGWHWWEKIFDGKGEANENVIGVYRLRPDAVSIIPDAQHYWKGIRFKRTEDDIVELLPHQVVAFRNWSPVNDFAPVSGLFAAQSSVIWDIFGRTWNTSFFRNGALPEFVIKSKNRLDDDEELRVKTKFKNRAGHPDVWRDPIVLDDGLEIGNTAQSSREMEFAELMTKARDEILSSLKVPPAMVGVPISGGLGGFREQRHQFYQLTILPLLRKIEATINQFLAPKGESMKFAACGAAGDARYSDDQRGARRDRAAPQGLGRGLVAGPGSSTLECDRPSEKDGGSFHPEQGRRARKGGGRTGGHRR